MATVSTNDVSSSLYEGLHDGDFIDLTESEKNTEDDDCVCVHLGSSSQIDPMDKDISSIVNQKLTAASQNLNFCEILANRLQQKPRNNIIIHDNKVVTPAKTACGFVMKKLPQVDPGDVVLTPSPVEVRQKKFPVGQSKESQSEAILLHNVDDLVDRHSNSKEIKQSLPKIMNFELTDRLGLPKKTVKKTADSKNVQTYASKKQISNVQNGSNIMIQDIFTMDEHSKATIQTESTSEDIICLSDEETDVKTSSETVEMTAMKDVSKNNDSESVATIRDVSKLVDPSKAVQTVEDICETESAVATITSNKDQEGCPVYILLCPLDPKTGVASVDGQVNKILALVPKDSALLSKTVRQQISDVSSSSERFDLIEPPSLVTPDTLQKQVAGGDVPPLVRLQTGATLTKVRKEVFKRPNFIDNVVKEKETSEVPKAPVILNTFSLSSDIQTVNKKFASNIQTPIKRRITTQRNYKIPAPVSHPQVTDDLTLNDMLHEREEEEDYATPITLNDLVKDNKILYKVKKQLVQQVPNQSLSLRKVKVFDPAQVEDRSLFKVSIPQSPNQKVIRPEKKTETNEPSTSHVVPKKKIVRAVKSQKPLKNIPQRLETSRTLKMISSPTLKKMSVGPIGEPSTLLGTLPKTKVLKNAVELESDLYREPSVSHTQDVPVDRIPQDPIEVQSNSFTQKHSSLSQIVQTRLQPSQNQDVEIPFSSFNVKKTDPPKNVRQDPIGVDTSTLYKTSNSGPLLFTPVDIKEIINKGKKSCIPGRCKLECLEYRSFTTIHQFRGFTRREKMRCPSIKDLKSVIKKNEKDMRLLKNDIKKRDESNFITCGGSSEFFLPEIKQETVYLEEDSVEEQGKDETIDPEDLPTINEVISKVNAEVLALRRKHKGTNPKTDKALELIKKGLQFIKNMSHAEEPQTKKNPSPTKPQRKQTTEKITPSPPKRKRKTIEKNTPFPSKSKRKQADNVEDDEVQYIGHVRSPRKRAKTRPVIVTTQVKMEDEQSTSISDNDLFVLKRVDVLKPNLKKRRRRKQ